MEATPNFRIKNRGTKLQRVVLICSNCDKDIRVLKPHEEVSPKKGYYCEECDDGAVHLNMPIKGE